MPVRVVLVGATALATKKVCASHDALSHCEVCQYGMRSHLSAIRQAPGSHMQAWDGETKSAADCLESRIVIHFQALFGGDYQACRPGSSLPVRGHLESVFHSWADGRVVHQSGLDLGEAYLAEELLRVLSLKDFDMQRSFGSSP